jgi:hypothetical protein
MRIVGKAYGRRRSKRVLLTYVDLSYSQHTHVPINVPDEMVHAWVEVRRKKKKLQNEWLRFATMGASDTLIKGIEEEMMELAEDVKEKRDRFWSCVDAQLPEDLRGGKGMIHEWWMPRVMAE